MARQFEGYRQRRINDVNAAYEAVLAGGYPVTFEGVAETLQCRNDMDRCNWLGVLSMCAEGIAAGLGDDPVPLGIRCTSNRSYVVSINEAMEIVRGLRAWAALAQANCWRLKDEVRACPNRDALGLIDLSEGWP